MLSSICFMPASLTPQSLPPFSPIMASIFRRQHRRDVHARRVVPDEERLAGLLGVVAVEEVDDVEEISSSTVFDRSSVSGPSSLQVWFFWRAIGGLAPDDRTRRRQTDRRPGIDGARGSDRPGPACSCTAARCLLGRRLVDVGEAHLLHRVQMVEVAPVFLEAVRGRQRLGVVAEMVLAELAGRVAEIVQELGERRGAGPQIGSGCPAIAAGSCPCAADTCR